MTKDGYRQKNIQMLDELDRRLRRYVSDMQEQEDMRGIPKTQQTKEFYVVERALDEYLEKHGR